jgi:hypothetical protein
MGGREGVKEGVEKKRGWSDKKTTGRGQFRFLRFPMVRLIGGWGGEITPSCWGMDAPGHRKSEQEMVW